MDILWHYSNDCGITAVTVALELWLLCGCRRLVTLFLHVFHSLIGSGFLSAPCRPCLCAVWTICALCATKKPQ